MQTKVLKTKQERGEFLENDFADRLIRIEQRVSAKYGKLIKYQDTYCYKNMSPEAKNKYDKFLKDKKKKKFVFGASLMIPLFGILALSNVITGNVVKEGVGETSYNLLFVVFGSFFLGLILGATFFFVYKKLRNKKVDPLFEPLEKLSKGKKKTKDL